MKKNISMIIAATSLAIGTAFAQVPAKTEVTNDAPVGALNECYGTLGDQPRTALQSCLERKTSEASAQMHIAYKKLEAETKEIDSSSTPKALASLLASQQAFEAFKAAQCQWAGDAAMGGSGAGDFVSACNVDLIRWRTKQLSD
jgi:uncharacterized protein YecT (DUF1311 family)